MRGGDKSNVIPSEIILDLDGRLLPGYTPQDMEAELRSLLGEDFELDILLHEPGPAKPNMGLFPTLADILKQKDPSGNPIPYVLTAVTDARLFSKLGIQTYGFTPMKLDEDFAFSSLVHAANERIPVDALEFGTDAILQALQSFGEAK